MKKSDKKKRPKKVKKDKANSETSDEYDASKVIYTGNPLTDLFIYIRNNNILCGIVCRDKKHPFGPFRRFIVFVCYLSLLILLTAFITKNAYICKQVPSEAAVTEPQHTARRLNAGKEEAPQAAPESKPSPKGASPPANPSGVEVCENQITAISLIVFILGIYILHRFALMITACGRIDSNGSSNIIMQIIRKIIGKFFVIPMVVMTALFTVKGATVFIRVGEPILYWVPIISIVLGVSLAFEFICDIIAFMRKRSIELKQNAIRGAAFDAHSDLRGSIKKRNIYVAVGNAGGGFF